MMSDDKSAEEDRRVNALVEYIQSLGLERLARDISDERVARRILEGQHLINSYNIQKSIEDDRQDGLEERRLAIQAQMIDKAAGFNNIIITLGYAGFFAIWNFVSDQLHQWDTALVALLLGASLIVYILWTLMVSFQQGISVRKIGAVYSKDFDSSADKINAVMMVEARVNESSLKLQKFWVYIFAFASSTGFLAGILLICLLLLRVLGIDFDLFDIWIAIVGPPTYEV